MQLDWNNDSGGPIFQPKDKNMGEFTFDHFTYEKRISDYNITGKFYFHVVILPMLKLTSTLV